MTARLAIPLLATAAALATTGSASAVATLGHGPGLPTARRVVIGHSVLGHRITARRVGDRDASRKALVVGNIHGDEPEGLRASRAVRRLMRGRHGIDLWVIDTVNPDGLAAHRRQNARGVDLNRNFGTGWKRTGPRGTRYYAGPRPFSEPETRAVRALARRLRPAVTVWYHQPYGYVIPPDRRGDAAIARDYARLTHNAVRNPPGPRLTGTATMWENRTVRHSTAFVVELPAQRLPGRTIARHARAAIRVARLGRSAA